MSSHASLSPPNLPENQFAKLPLMLSGNLQAVSSQGTTVTAGITATWGETDINGIIKD